ncbi:hypothetical protein HUA78_45135 [Myxococcus sp. CA033]|uniref:hypothetical protein n=1 Tax=Myxococcus sp. CA033 TaxID=2741516 RepID=UPI00157A46E0|nr:hypothetical protein [Myxococcus sp. CA033]NTX41639.1 hypothetical protein [Myxococcus sp. CA033]
MSRNRRLGGSVLLAAALFSTPGLADDEVTNVLALDRYPVPAVRESKYRNRIATELGGGGWQTFVGDLHNHPRGHDAMDGGSLSFTPQIIRSEVLLSAFRHGYDFFGTSNHTTSWKSYDDDDPISQLSPVLDANGQSELLVLRGRESHVGPDDGTGSSHDHHFNSFNRNLHVNSSNIGNMHDEIVDNYSADPLLSTHIQLNHPNDDVYFTLPTAPDRRQKVRDAVELAEYNGLPKYFELLRRGFRVAPVSNTDAHSTTREQLGGAFMEQHPNGTWVRRYIDEPGVPREKTHGHDTAQGRAGVVLPPGTPFNYDNFLIALRNRSVFRTALPPASGFFMVNGRPMGSEFALSPTERRLDFTVWGTTKDGTGGGNNWTTLQVWSPFQPNAPIKEIPYTDIGLIDLKEVFSLTPYESIYVVTLRQQWENAEVVMAPIWVTNPVSKPVLSLPDSVVTRSSQYPYFTVSGGGDTLLLQRSTPQAPQTWQTVGTITSNHIYYPIDHHIQPRVSHWRVVDAYQQTVVSNTTTLTVTDLIDVTASSGTSLTLDGDDIHVHWSHPAPQLVDYYLSQDSGLTWTKVGEESAAFTDRHWTFDTAGLGGSTLMLKVVNRLDVSYQGFSGPVTVSHQIRVGAGNATVNPMAAYTVADRNKSSCWWSSNGNSQSVYVYMEREYLIKRMEIDFGQWNPTGWAMAVGLNGSTWSTSDSGSMSYGPNQTVVADYSQRPGGGLIAKHVRLYVSGTFPGVSSYSQVCEIRLYH